ncbi:hypothetical protein [Xylanibacter caecicola]|uniref:hypothetical protein n=1 Tax=Xylanibacter caecicola TaxID=2736294 RepID=UPI002582E78E|nr:hypothetical protein [Xylanibacter caecicola]
MEIIEKTIIGKRTQQECEDGITVNDRFVAVIDGSTSKTAARIDSSMSNGRFCMETIKAFIDNMPAKTSMEEFCKGITNTIYKIYAEYGYDINRLRAMPTERATASAVIYSRHHRQVWLVGDCHCMVNGTYYDNPKPYEESIAARRSAFIKNELDKCKDAYDLQKSIDGLRVKDTGRIHILPELIAACSHQNKNYAVIDGFDMPVNLIKVINVPPQKTEIILASDGYPFIKSTLKQSNEALMKLINTDPLLIDKYQATKGVMKGYNSFDDRSYVRFRD